MCNLQVCAPLDGVIIPLKDVPDPVFSEKMLGDGLAIDSSEGVIKAPFSGKITSFHKMLHAFVISSQNIELLVHVGIETINLNREGFTPLVNVGDEVTQGQPILKFSPELVAQKALCPYTLLIVTAPTHAQITQTATGIVHAGDSLFTVHLPAEEKPQNFLTDYVESAPIVIRFSHGLHARPAGLLAAEAAHFSCPIQLIKNKQTANAKSVLEIMQLSISQNEIVSLRVFAPKETAQKVLTALEPILQKIPS